MLEILIILFFLGLVVAFLIIVFIIIVAIQKQMDGRGNIKFEIDEKGNVKSDKKK